MDYASATDEELMGAYVAGDPRAFRALFDRYTPRLLGMLRRGLADPHAVQDIVQQTFLQFHRARNDFRQGARLRPWLYTIALNVRREHFRRVGRRREDAQETFDQHASRQTDRDPVVQKQTAQLVRAALATLPDAQREVIELHWLAEMPFPEVAEVVGASLSAVKVRAHRGYARLREAVRGALGGNQGAIDAVLDYETEDAERPNG